jgi:hypothetical protein
VVPVVVVPVVVPAVVVPVVLPLVVPPLLPPSSASGTSGNPMMLVHATTRSDAARIGSDCGTFID